jgi:hypothetical protein
MRPTETLTWFARGQYDRALFTRRDGARVISLPVVNGGAGQHAHTPYYPIPFIPGLVAGVPERTFPFLVPELRRAGAVGAAAVALMPLAYQQQVERSRRGGHTRLSWTQPMLDRVGGRGPVADSSGRVATAYTFMPGTIEREDRWSSTAWGPADSLQVSFASFDSVAMVSQLNRQTWRFTMVGGIGRHFVVTGYTSCRADPLNATSEYRTPVGAHRTLIRCSTPWRGPAQTVRWQLTYNNGIP